MKVSILVFPGTNREVDMHNAVKHVTGYDVEYIWHKDHGLKDADLVILPGGFSYGDYLRCGAMAAHSPVMQDVIEFARKGGRLFGVCNGFQMLVETQLLPGALLRNRDLRFICRNVHLKGQDDGVYKVPVAHGEGNYFANDNIVAKLEDDNAVAYRYSTEEGAVLPDHENLNGSVHSIAGVYNKQRTILGMMPHPENAALPHHKSQDGQAVIKAMLKELF